MTGPQLCDTEELLRLEETLRPRCFGGLHMPYKVGRISSSHPVIHRYRYMTPSNPIMHDTLSTESGSLPFSLRLNSHTFVSGELLSGHVTLNLAHAQRDYLSKLTVELVGMSHT